MSKIVNMAVDLGNYNIKTSEEEMFLSTFTEGMPKNPQGEDIIKIDDKVYCMAKESSFDYEFNKNKKNYKPNLFYAIAKSIKKGDDHKINLVLGVPLENFGVASNFKGDLEGKTFDFNYNDKDIKVTFNNVGVVGEGISSFYTLDPKKRVGDIMIVDIGGRTINVATFRDGKIEHKRQLNKGMINFYDTVKERHNSEFGENLNTEQMYSYIEKNIVKVDHEDELKFIDYALNEIKKFADVRFYEVYFTGGGAPVLEDTIKELHPKAKFMENPLFTNVKGNKAIAEVQWSE